MSYYNTTDPSDRSRNRLIMRKKWDDVWTYCNVEDLKNWWNHFGKHCSHIKSEETLQGILVQAFDCCYFCCCWFKKLNCLGKTRC